MGQAKNSDTGGRSGSGKPRQANEGEGNRTAARNYNRDTKKFVKAGRVEKSADAAARAVGGPEGADLRRAEREGRSKARS